VIIRREDAKHDASMSRFGKMVDNSVVPNTVSYMIVLDTNVIYSALRSQRGASFRLLEKAIDGGITFAVSTALIFEYEDVLKRNLDKLEFSVVEIDEVLDGLVHLGARFSSHFLWRPFLRDAKDDMILELAVVSGSSRIITYNIKDFRGSANFSVEVMRPFEYLKKEKLL
jgi:putative PIN family toxin of toxin-antitoxin system